MILNTNLVHNILNGAIALTSGATAILLATGCGELANGVLLCSNSWLSPEVATVVVTVLAVAKVVINIVRDGLVGLAKPQPPVEQ